MPTRHKRERERETDRERERERGRENRGYRPPEYENHSETNTIFLVKVKFLPV